MKEAIRVMNDFFRFLLLLLDVLFIVRSTVVTIASPLVVLGRVTCCDDGDVFAWVPDPSYSQWYPLQMFWEIVAGIP